MKRPVIKDKEILKYVEFLEGQLEEFTSHTKKKFYRGIQRQLDILADEMLDDGFQVSLKSEFIQKGEKYVKVDNGFDGFFDMLTKGNAIIQALEKFEEQALPKKDEGKKTLSEGSAENFIKK